MRSALVITAVLFLATLFARLPAATTEDSGAFTVGLVFDVGGLGDKSFNDSAYLGLQRAERELGVRGVTIEPGDGSDRAAALRMLAASGAKVVIGVGFIFTDDIIDVAEDYPQVAFACVDMAVRSGPDGAPEALPGNVTALKFREEEGSFLAGVVAARLSPNKKVGFIGGMDIPLIHKFSAGYVAGVKAECEACSVSVLFAGATPNAFKDPGKGREMALSMYQNGADVVFHAAGATGLGVFQAAREQRKLAIGVDSDQAEFAPAVVATSMVKRVDTAVFDAVARAKAGALRAGVVELGLKDDGLTLIANAGNAQWLDAAMLERLAEWREQIESGKVQVPDRD